MANCGFVSAVFIFTFLPCIILAQQQGTVRLWRNGVTSNSFSSGRVQIYFGGRWGNICDDFDFSTTEATVICHQLGYSSASALSNDRIDAFGTDSVSIVLDEVDCRTSGYLAILQCFYSSFIGSNCNNGVDDVSVTCFSTRIWNSPFNGQIRLSQGDYTNKGLVEVYCSGRWGTVCDDSFGLTEAIVVCRQLGYSTAARYDHLSVRGSSSQPIWLDNVDCPSSSFNCLGNCQRCSTSHNCDHSKDVTIECASSSGSRPLTTTTTCRNASPVIVTSSLPGIITGVVIAIIVCTFLPIFIPICICICLGVGIGASCRNNQRPTTRVVTTAVPPPTTAVVTNTVTTVEKSEYLPPGPPKTAFNDPAPPYPSSQSAYPPAPYPSQPYPANPGYPPQQEFQQPPPPAYPGEPVGYGGYPPNAYPPPPGPSY